MLIVAHYGEIAIKGKNKRKFEELLLKNIRRACGKGCTAKIKESRILIDAHGKNPLDAVGTVFGIEAYAEAVETRADIEAIWDAVSKMGARLRRKRIRVDTKRADKQFPIKSPQVNAEIGKRIVEGFGCGVDLENPDVTVHIEICRKKAYVYTDRRKGLGGLPVGSSGKVLCLFSGGIDSPAAAWMMMKRGCEVDFLHVHPFEKSSKVKGTKIERLVHALNKFQGPSEMLLAPYSEFYKRSFEIGKGYELVVFRRFLYKLAEKIAKEKKYLGIVSGDSLGQVASQTIYNIGATQCELSVPIFRPLIGLDKNEIIAFSKKAGLLELSLEKYKDCCSLVAVQHPATKAKREKVEKLLEDMEGEKAIEETIKKLKTLKVN